MSEPRLETSTLVGYLDRLLNPSAMPDYCPNGLQVEGSPCIAKAVCAVTASLAVVEECARRGATALLVHHGYFWRGEDARLIGVRRRRIAALLAAEINLIAYHLPLDLHPVYGNNATFGALMGWSIDATGGERGLIALCDLAEPIDAKALADGLESRLAREPLLVGDTGRTLRRIAWCTGAAQDLLEPAIALGADAFVSGEISERTTHLAREAGVLYAAAGHHATERYGVQALAAHLTERFAVPIDFIDDPNPV